MSAVSDADRSGLERRYASLLVLAALCAYFNSFGGVPLLDDNGWIMTNPNIGRLYPFILDTRPVVSASFTLNYWLDGLNLRGYHAVNLTIHILAALTLFGIVRRTLALPQWSDRVRACAATLAFVIALIWVVHPLNTQAVTYVIQRCESLMGLFYLLTVYCVLRGATGPIPWRSYAAAVACLAAGLGCKEVIVTAPVVVLLYDWTFLSPSLRELVRRRWGLYLALAAPAVLFAGWLFLGGALAGNATLLSGRLSFGPREYALTQAGVVLHYLRLSAWPVPLCLEYLDWPVARSLADCYPAAAVVGILLLATAWGVVRRAWWGFLGAWFFLILAPTSSILPIQDVAFEHRMYLSLAGVIALAAGLLFVLLEQARERSPVFARLEPGLTVALVGLTVAVFGWLTIARNAQYCDLAAMLHDLAAKRPQDGRARDVVAELDLFAGRGDQAEQEAREAVRMLPGYCVGHNTLGRCLLQSGHVGEAVGELSLAAQMAPPTLRESFSADLGRAFLLGGDARRAVEPLAEAVRLNPRDADHRVWLAVSLREVGRTDEADAADREAVQCDPAVAKKLNRAARLCIFRPDTNPASVRQGVLLAEAACRLSHEEDADCLDTLGIAYASAGRFAEAQDAARKAVERANAVGQTTLADQAQQRLALYKRHQPYTALEGASQGS
jgi:Flp pilus assembly protein TadD